MAGGASLPSATICLTELLASLCARPAGAGADPHAARPGRGGVRHPPRAGHHLGLREWPPAGPASACPVWGDRARGPVGLGALLGRPWPPAPGCAAWARASARQTFVPPPARPPPPSGRHALPAWARGQRSAGRVFARSALCAASGGLSRRHLEPRGGWWWGGLAGCSQRSPSQAPWAAWGSPHRARLLIRAALHPNLPSLQTIDHFVLGMANADAAPFIPNWCEVIRRTLRRAAQSVSVLPSFPPSLRVSLLPCCAARCPRWQAARCLHECAAPALQLHVQACRLPAQPRPACAPLQRRSVKWRVACWRARCRAPRLPCCACRPRPPTLPNPLLVRRCPRSLRAHAPLPPLPPSRRAAC